MHPITWLKARGNPIDWVETEKAIVASAVEICLYFSFFCIALLTTYSQSMQSIVNLDICLTVGKFSLMMIVLWGLILLFTLHIRRKNPESTLPSIINTYLAGSPLMVMAVFNGVPVLVTGLLLASTPVFGLILFNSRHVLVATALTWIQIILIGIGVGFGYLPDAPLYVKAANASDFSLAWFLIQILIGLPAVGLGLFVVNSLLNGLRSREEKILMLSRRDSLTSVWNRRYLTEMLEHELAVSRRSASPISVVMIDLDFFKKINDGHGHATGDKVLVLTAATLQQALRETDYIGRFGGEEFVAILPACDEKTAMIIAERCRSMIEALVIETDGTKVPVSASFGVSTAISSEAMNSSYLLSIADQALYQAKNAGRNRVIFNPPAPKPFSTESALASV